MKSLSVIIAIVLTGMQVAIAQSGSDLFQQAVMKERAEGNLEDAIAIYERVVEEHSSDRKLVATALVQMGRNYERLGQAGQARQVFERVAREYPDQETLAEEARSRLTGGFEGKETGMVVRQVWTGPEIALGSPSPDGKYLTFVDWTTGDLALRDLDSEQTRDITNKGTWEDSGEYAEVSVWAPDGRHVVYSWFNESFYDLRIVAVEGGEPRILYSNPETDYLWPAAWSQDGSQILTLLVKPDKTMRIALIDVKTGTARELTSLDWKNPPRKMDLSPDGRFVVYDAPVAQDQPQHDIYLLASDGSRKTTLVDDEAMDYGPMWTPDGKHILFVSDRKGTLDLWALPMDGDKPLAVPRLIRQNVGRIRPVGFSTKGAFFYSLANSMRDVYTAPLNLETGEIGAPTLATSRFVGSNTEPAWSPDGSQLAFFSRRQAGAHVGFLVILVIKDIESGEERDLNLPLRIHQGIPLGWSLDGHSLFTVAQNARGRRGVYRIDASSGQTSFVTPIEGGNPQVWPGADERVVYRHRLGFQPNANVELVVHDLRSGTDRLLYNSHHLHAAAISPDGQYMAFATDDELPESGESNSNVLKVISLAGGDAKELTRVSATDQIIAINWMPDGNELTYLRQLNPGSTELKTERMRISVDGGDPTPDPITLPHPIGSIDRHAISLHPNGSQVAYTFGKASTEFWMMEEFIPVEGYTP